MDQTQAIWIKDPLSILAEGAERGVVVRGGKIVELVGKGREPATAPAAIYDASAHVVLPGLINTHHHFYQTLTRALPAAMDRELFPWLQALYPVWARLTPESLDLGVTVAMSELLLSGCTTTTDHHYVFPGGLEDAVDIEVAAAKRLGLRVLLTRGSMNLSQKDGGLPPDSVVQDEDTILADCERVVAKHHQRGEDAMVQIALAPCSPFSVTTSLMSRNRGREQILRADVRLPSAGLSRTMRLAQRQNLAGARHLLQAGRDEAAWQGENLDQPLRLQQSNLGVRLLPGLRDGGGRRLDRSRRRRFGLERRVQFDAGGPRRVSLAARPLWRDQGQPQGRAALGHQGLRRLRRPS
jgi:cytosine/adenosine deaminase-related metal-dependent hydrolase